MIKFKLVVLLFILLSAGSILGQKKIGFQISHISKELYWTNIQYSFQLFFKEYLIATGDTNNYNTSFSQDNSYEWLIKIMDKEIAKINRRNDAVIYKRLSYSITFFPNNKEVVCSISLRMGNKTIKSIPFLFYRLTPNCFAIKIYAAKRELRAAFMDIYISVFKKQLSKAF